MTALRGRAAMWASLAFLILATTAIAQTTPVNGGLNWLASHQNANGTWGSHPDLVPRDTARALIALSLHRSTSPSLTAGVAWLGSQRGFEANQFLAEQSVALSLAKYDASASLQRLSLQRSTAGPDYGGFIDHTGDSYDSALALQALATQEGKYLTAIAGVVTTLITRQNADGGWGIDTGFASNPVLTAEVLAALSSTAAQQAPPATVAAAQAYLAARMNPDGSIGIGPLETATAFRALALSGYPLSQTATATLAYLTTQQSADGSWSGDAYLTARVLEAYAANKSNLAIKTGDFTLTPSSVNEGANVSASVKVTNIGSAISNAATTVKLYVGDVKGRELATSNFATLAAGQTRTVTLTFAATTLTGTQTIAAVVDPQNAVDEMRKDDNASTATLAVAGKPDLQVFSADIVSAPARLQPNQEGSLNVTIRNNGEGEAKNAGYAIYQVTGGKETLLKKATVESIAAEGAAVVSIPVTLPAGTHTIRAVADPDAQLTESNEANNQASKSISVTAAANVDLRIRAGEVWTDPQRPTEGQSFGIVATIDNAGLERVTSTVAFYDGVPNAGGVVIAAMPITIAAQSTTQVQVTHVASATSRVVYAVADPDDLLPEVDEGNNGGHALLTDQFADLVLTREGFVLPRATLSNGAKLEARLVVRNNGVLPATAVRVVVHDDLPQNGGIKVLDTTIDVPGMGKTVVPVSWNVRAGQRFATAEVNDGHSVFEPTYANNRVTKLYTPAGSEGDVRLNGARASAIDTTKLVVDQATLTISGTIGMNLVTPVARPFTVTLFEDVDGDLAFNGEVDTALGSTLVPAGPSTQYISVGGQGTLRFAPGKLVLHLDSSNAIAENNEGNNFIDVWQDCQNQAAGFVPGIKWRTNQIARNLAPVARFRDTNGDDIVDDNDAPYIVHATGGAIALHRGDNGQRLWIRNFGFFGRQLSSAIGDLDGDGIPEILAANYRHRIVALDVNGNTKWQSPEIDIHPDWEPWLFFKDFTYIGAPAIADLEGDGAVEIVVGRTVLNGADGTIKWVGTGSSGRAFNDHGWDLYNENFPDQEAPITVDLTGDGKLEVVAGSTAYRADGTILWHRGDLGDGYAGAVTLPGQTTPSVVLVAHGRVTLLRGTDGGTVWGPVNIPNGARMGGAPTVFMDGSTGPWVGVAGDGYYTVFNGVTGAVKWTKKTTEDFSFGIITTASATAFDFGSGMTLAYAARQKFYLLRASDGATLYEMANGQSQFFPTAPVVADIDGDGRTDVAVPGNDGMKIISDPRWNGTRGVFNQLSYNVANVSNERAGIPAVVTPTAFSKTHFRSNAPQPATAIGVTGQPNLTASYMRADTSGFPASAKLTVRAGNNGWFQAIDTKVAFYRVSGNTTALAGTATLRDLPPGDYEDVTFTFANPPADTTGFYAVVDDGGTANSGEVVECNETDNKSQTVSVRLTTDILVTPTSLVVSDPQPRRGETIELIATAEISAAVNPANVRAQFYLGDPAAGGAALSAPLPVTVTTEGDRRLAGATMAWNVTAPVGVQSIVVVFDPANAITETDETNNKAAVAINVGASAGQPDLQVFASDINTSPSQLQPGQQATVTVTIRNAGKGDASSISWALYDDLGATSTLLTRGTIAALPLGSGQIVSATATLAGGTHSIRAVVDPDNTIAESNETNNTASRSISVSPASNVDFKVATVTANPSRPAAGQSITIRATVENGGSEAGESTLGFYDGAPGHGGKLIAIVPLSVGAQSSVTLERTYVTLADSIAVYAVADPDKILPEIDESNNAAYAVLTDSWSDLAVTRDDIALSATNVSAGQTLSATITVRNRGMLAASNVSVVVYDDATGSGGRVVFETRVDVPAQGSVNVPASFAARAGQRFATVVVNGDESVVETDFSNNRATRFYSGSGDEADLSLDTTVARDVAIDTTGLTISASELSISGNVKLRLNTPGTKTFTVLVFEDADGDLAYDSEVDKALGSALVDAGVTPQNVEVAVQGTLRFLPGKLAVYIDSSNAVSETDESNNLLDLWQDCRVSDVPRSNLTASYVRFDGSGYPASAKVIARVGNNGSATAVQSGVAFHAVSAGGTTLLGTATVPQLRPGAYADVQLVIANPSAATTAVYAVADGPGLVTECDESDNRSTDVSVQFSSDIMADTALLLVSDPEPRQGDTIDFVAVARLFGAVSESQVKAQFYLGNPSAGGAPISGVLTAPTSSTRGSHSATASFRWTVTAPLGPQAIYVVFDPAGVVAEDDETNNRGIYSLNVTSPDPVRKLSGTISLNPPAVEPGSPVDVSIFIKNIGNVPLSNLTLRYTVSGGAGTGFDGSASVATLPKNDIAIVKLGKFTPASEGEYTVVVTPSDESITLIAGPKAIKVAPFAAAMMTAAPKLVPVSVPLVQAHTKISRGNTIIVPDDPLVPLLKTHIQRGLNWQAQYINADLNADFCFRCHVTAQGMVSFEESRKVSGVTVDTVVAERIFLSTANNQWSNGMWHGWGERRSTTAVGAWSLAYWHDGERAKPYLIRSLEGMLELQNKGGSQDGAWECDHCFISYGSREAHTMMGIIAMARGWELTKDKRYYDSMISAVNWTMRYDWQGNAVSRGPEWAARTSIGLSAALPQISDEALASTVRKRIDTIAAYLRSVQQADGSFGTFTTPDEPIIRNAQSLYALSLAGVPGSDPSIRTAIVWLLNHQQPNGAWREARNDNNQEHWVDETTWAMIALPAAFLRLGQFDVDYDVFLPTDTEYVSASPVPLSVNPVAGGKQLKWKLKDVNEAGQELLLNVNLNGIGNNEQRPVVGRATLNYTHPYTGEKTSRNLDIPQVTGFAPLRLSISTDKPSYAPNTQVEITEVAENVGAATVGVTNDVVIRDDNGTTVATVITDDVIEGFPADPFPAWNYAIPVTVPVTNGGVNRLVIMSVDFGAKLAALGATGTFDTNSIRVTADNAAAQELFYNFQPDGTSNPDAGKLVVTIPDSAAAGTTVGLHIYFDTIENGFKPASMFDRSRASNGSSTASGQGFLGRYYALDTAKQGGYVSFEKDVKYFEPPLLTRLETNSYMASAFPAGVQRDFFVVVWTGVVYAPVTGTYQFELGSDDGSWLSIDGVELINNGGGHGVIHRYASKQLTAGFHSFRVTMFEWGGGEYLSLAWAPPGKGWEILPPNSLYTSFPAADPSSVVVGNARVLTHGTVTRKFTWNTGSTATGPYSVLGTLKQFGSFVTDASAAFSITPAAEVSGSIVTDKPVYDSGETVRANGSVRYDAGNVTLTNVNAVVSVLDAADTVKATKTTPIASLIPGQAVAARLAWSAGSSEPGTYTAKLVVLDSSGAQLAETSAAFELRSTAVSGKGVSGTITTPATVQQGESLPISISITNGGNSALTDAPFAVTILDPETQAPVATLNFTASIGADATYTLDLTHATATMPLQTYQAYLVSMITGSAVPLSNTTFEVKAPPLKLELSTGGPSRVLIWADCANGNSATPCTAVAPAFLTQTLTAAGIPWTLVGTQTEALAAFRTGAYDEVVLYQQGPYQAKIDDELVETVRGGLGLLLIKGHPDAMPKLAPALGAKFNGKLAGPSTLLDLLQTPFTAASQITLNGDGVKVGLEGAQAAAKISATQAPAISYHTFGAGRVVVVPFDTEKTRTPDVAKLLVDSVNYVARVHTYDARQVVPIDFTVTPPPGAPASLTIGFTVPQGMSLVHASPALTSTAPGEWSITSNGEPFHLYLWVRLPDAAGPYTITGTAGFAGQTAVVTKTLEVVVAADRVAIEAALASDLEALAATAPAGDRKSISDAQAHLAAVKALGVTKAPAAITRILQLIESLRTVSVDTTAARNDADRLLVWWQSRV
ncbi:MAG TPA: CARDB domain-containing protein [Thermoanaerobaculia bacterium]